MLNLGSVSATAESRDTLRLSAGTTARFGFTLNGPAVGVCDFGGASGAPCDHAFGAATSSFSANIGTGAVRFEVDQQADTRTTQIFGTFDPLTRLLLSDPVSITGPVELEMLSISQANTKGPLPVPNERFSTQAVANFGDTATLTEILVFDADGNLLPDVTITSDSGTIYPLAPSGGPGGGPGTPPGTPMPAPPALLLMGAGLAGLLGSRFRHASRLPGGKEPGARQSPRQAPGV